MSVTAVTLTISIFHQLLLCILSLQNFAHFASMLSFCIITFQDSFLFLLCRPFSPQTMLFNLTEYPWCQPTLLPIPIPFATYFIFFIALCTDLPRGYGFAFMSSFSYKHNLRPAPSQRDFFFRNIHKKNYIPKHTYPTSFTHIYNLHCVFQKKKIKNPLEIRILSTWILNLIFFKKN